MKVIYNKILPSGGRKAINLFGYVFAKEELTDVELNHEEIHTAQMKEMAYAPFYVWYGIEWLARWIKTRDTSTAYASMGFERECEANEENAEYLDGRAPWAWIAYLKGGASSEGTSDDASSDDVETGVVDGSTEGAGDGE